MKPRGEFLLHLFDNLWDDINTNVKAIWLLITLLLLGSFATVIFTKANIVPMITTYSMVMISIIWIMAHITSAGHLFNSSITIISDIEKQFLTQENNELVHLYFAKHRPSRVIPHFWLQQAFLIVLMTFLLIYYTSKIPYGIIFYNHHFSMYLMFYLIPFFIMMGGTIFLVRFKKSALVHDNVTPHHKTFMARAMDWFDICLYMVVILLLVMLLFFYTARSMGYFDQLPAQVKATQPIPTFIMPKKEELVLNGVMVSNQSKIALINHQIYRVGDKVQGMRVARIAFNGVLLQNGNQTVILRTNSL